METNGMYEVLSPRGTELLKEASPLNERLADLTGKKIYLIDVGKPQSDDAFDAAEEYLRENLPKAKIVRTRKTTSYFDNEPTLWDDVQKDADAFILGSFD